VYTSYNPYHSLSFCRHSNVGSSLDYQMIALRCLPGRYNDLTGGISIANPRDQSVGSPAHTLVLKSSNQCLVPSSIPLKTADLLNEVASLRRSLFRQTRECVKTSRTLLFCRPNGHQVFSGDPTRFAKDCIDESGVGR